MQRKYFKIVLLLLAGQLIGETWHLFDGPNVRLISAFVYPPKYLPDITWYVKGITDEISKILWFSGFYTACNCLNTRLAGVIACFIFYFFCELILFFWCYKVFGYPYLYCATGIFLFLTLLKKNKLR
jgi:hypothetical protein